MSDEREKTPELAKIVNVIMQNPDIIEKISSLLTASEESAPEAPVSIPTQAEGQPTERVSQIPDSSARRTKLLSALKPYVRGSRAEAINSVIAIADILDMMRR